MPRWLVQCLNVSPCQFGFQKNSSTLQQLLLYYHQLITSKDEVDAVHIDFRKAFDSVPRSKLLLKLWNIGITGYYKLWKWFKSYLSDRVQCISIGNCLSSCLPVYCQVFLKEGWFHQLGVPHFLYSMFPLFL